MKNKFLWGVAGLVVVGVAILVLLNLRPGVSPMPQGNTTGVSPKRAIPEEIIIGAILPLTGPVGYLGEEEKNALLMARDEVNGKAQGQKLRVLIEDSRSTAKDGVAAYHRLRMDKVRYVITSMTIVSEAVSPLCQQDGVLQVALSVHPDIAKNAKGLLRPYYGLEDEMRRVADYLASKKAKRVAALYINTPEGSVAIGNYFRRFLDSAGIILVGQETYEFSDKSVKNQLSKLQSLDPDFIMTIDFGYMYPTILNEAAGLGMKAKILGGLGMMTAPPMPAELTAGVVFASASFAVSPTPAFDQFSAQYKAKYGKPVTFDGVYTYDACKMLYDGACAGKTEFKDFVGTTYDGVSGPMVIDGSGTGRADIALTTR